MTDVVALAAELLAIPSSTGDERAVVDFVARWLIARGWNVHVQEVSKGRGNVWASRAGGGVALSTHLDTVPPYIPPRLDGDHLYGRGSCDAKGIAAAMMAAADRLAASGEQRVDLLLVVGEEKGSDGARAANRLTPTSRNINSASAFSGMMFASVPPCTTPMLTVVLPSSGSLGMSSACTVGRRARSGSIADFPR